MKNLPLFWRRKVKETRQDEVKTTTVEGDSPLSKLNPPAPTPEEPRFTTGPSQLRSNIAPRLISRGFTIPPLDHGRTLGVLVTPDCGPAPSDEPPRGRLTFNSILHLQPLHLPRSGAQQSPSTPGSGFAMTHSLYTPTLSSPQTALSSTGTDCTTKTVRRSMQSDALESPGRASTRPSGKVALPPGSIGRKCPPMPLDYTEGVPGLQREKSTPCSAPQPGSECNDEEREFLLNTCPGS